MIRPYTRHMKNKAFFLFALLFSIYIPCIHAQGKLEFKFGKVTSADFKIAQNNIDSGASALILADVGSTSFEGNNKGFFTLIFTRFMRVKILRKNGFDLGSQAIELYHDFEGNEEKLSVLNGSTFTLENGLVTESKLDEKSVFTEKYNKNIDLKKFTLPSLKEGVIFDLQYTVRSPFYSRLQPWSFQGKYPCLWSEYTVTIAPPFHYVMKLQGDTHFDINSTKGVVGDFSIRVEEANTMQTSMYTLSGTSIQERWVKKNVPSLHEEPFLTTLDNYNSRVSFQLSYFQWTEKEEKQDHMTTWKNTSKQLLESENFGKALNYENNWMSEDLNNLTKNTTTDEDKARAIFNYVQDNFRAYNKDGYSKEGLYVRSSLKDVFKKKEGNVAEINLLLTAMLRKAGIDAEPMILSTRNHGIANGDYPMIDEYNYVICLARVDGRKYTLDASESYSGFGQLPLKCYNGLGHSINQDNPTSMLFSPDSLHENRIATVIIFNDDKNQPSGSYTCQIGKNDSYRVRSEILGGTEKNYESKIKTQLGSDYTLENFTVDSLKQPNFPLTLHYDFIIKNLSSADIIYFNPIVDESYKSNPFKSMDRHYPVEMPYLLDQVYILNMDIPAGYEIDEMPKSVRVNYNENEGFFEYIIQKAQTSFQMRVHLKLNKAFFPVEEYQTLRDFFSSVVKKENEQIVFKKTK